MKRSWTAWMIVGLMISGISTVGAQEHAGKPLAEKKAPQAAPAGTTSTTAPKTARAQGSIKSLNLTSQAPELKLTASDGKLWTFGLNPKTVVVWKNGQLSKPEELKTGDRVNVRYAEKEGKNWVRAIEIVQAPQQPTTTAATPAPTPTPSMAPAAPPFTPPVPPVASPATPTTTPTEQKTKSNSP